MLGDFMDFMNAPQRTFIDVLKLSKIIAMERGVTRINLDIVRSTLALYFDTSDLADDVAKKLGIDRKKPLRSNGAEVLGRYPEKPALPIVKEVSDLKKDFGDGALDGLQLPGVGGATTPTASETASDTTVPERGDAPHPPALEIISFKDCLKLAKTFALARSAPEITLDVLRQALESYVDTTELTEDQARKIGGVARKPPQEVSGAAVLARYKAEPSVPLAVEVKALRDEFKDTRVFRLPATKIAALPSTTATTAPTSDATTAAAGPLAPEGRAALAEVTALIERLGGVVIGQPTALSGLRRELLARALNLNPPGKPRVLVLAGPAGTGKTLLARQIIEAHGGEGIVLNMASFQSHNEGFGLTGLREGYTDAGPGRLTGFVKKHPRGIVVFDNVDQAHPRIQDILANLLADGHVEDEYGFGGEKQRAEAGNRRVSFASTLLVFTLRPSEHLTEDGSLSALIRRDPQQAETLIAEDMIAGSPTANANRDNHDGVRLSPHLAHYLTTATILPFAELDISALVGIARSALLAFADVFAHQGIRVVFDDIDLTARIVTFALGPDIAALEVREGGTRWLTEALFTDVDADTAVPGVLKVAVTESVSAWFAERDLAELHRAIFRRREVLRYSIIRHREQGQLVLEIDAVRLERVKGHRDYGGDDGFTVEIPDLRFDDIKGHARVKERLRQIVRVLDPAPAEAARWRGAPPKGVLLYGRPGTGKTMLAKALAAEAGLPFIAAAGPQLFDTRYTHAIFARARRFSPSIVFIDEIDALGVRGAGGADPAINQLLSEIDGFASREKQSVFVIAATNFIAKVDPALIRSGRLDLHLEVPPLDREARRYFIESRLCNLPRPVSPAAGAWDIDALVALTAGMSGADLEKAYRETQLALAQAQTDWVTHDQLLEQINAIKYGERRHHPPLAEHLEAVAFHEAGHAVLAALLNPDLPIEQVSIVGRGDAYGFVAYSADSDHTRPFNRQEAMDHLCVKLAGRIAQLRQFPASSKQGGGDSGATADLASATELAWLAITRWGLDEEFGWISLAPFNAPLPAAWLERAQLRVDAWLAEARTRTAELVEGYWSTIELLAQRLLADETLDGAELADLVGTGKEAGHA